MLKQVEMMVMIGYIHYNSVLFYLLCISYYPAKFEYLKHCQILLSLSILIRTVYLLPLSEVPTSVTDDFYTTPSSSTAWRR